MRSARMRRRSRSEAIAPRGARTRAWSPRIVVAPGRRMRSVTASASASGGRPLERSAGEHDDVGRVVLGASVGRAVGELAETPEGGPQRREAESRAIVVEGLPWPRGEVAKAVAERGRLALDRAPAQDRVEVPLRCRPRAGSAPPALTRCRASRSGPASVRDDDDAPSSMPSTRQSSRTASEAIEVRNAWCPSVVERARGREVLGELAGRVAQVRRRPWARGLGRRQREEALVRDRLGRSEKVPQATTARSSRIEARDTTSGQIEPHLAAFLIIGTVRDADDDRVDDPDRGMPPRGRGCPAAARSDGPRRPSPSGTKASSRSTPARSEAATMIDAPRSRRPDLQPRPGAPALGRGHRSQGPCARRARRGPRGPRRCRRRPARCSRRGAGTDPRAGRSARPPSRRCRGRA